jgi:hypothetical protein
LGLVHTAVSALEEGLEVAKIGRALIESWHDRIRRRLSLEACLRNIGIREFASTLLTAVVGPESCVFSQLGDGAIVIGGPSGYQPVFWPQSGEYASTTFFLTGDDYQEHLQVVESSEPPDTLAMFTDGLQHLALHFASRSAHGPFFAPMFTALRTAGNPEDLGDPLRQFLASPSVCDRTDDDKTLLLATRLALQLP